MVQAIGTTSHSILITSHNSLKLHHCVLVRPFEDEELIIWTDVKKCEIWFLLLSKKQFCFMHCNSHVLIIFRILMFCIFQDLSGSTSLLFEGRFHPRTSQFVELHVPLHVWLRVGEWWKISAYVKGSGKSSKQDIKLHIIIKTKKT